VLAAQLVVLDQAKARLAVIRDQRSSTINAAAEAAAQAGVAAAVIARITGSL
jgi:hypothetical protein